MRRTAPTGTPANDPELRQGKAVLRADVPGRALLLAAVLALVVGALLLVPLWAGGSPAGAQDGGAEVPAKPTGLRVSTEEGSRVVSADWDDVAGAEEYLVRWRRQGPGHDLNEGFKTQSSSVSITMSDYGQWVVRVEGCNDAGCGLGAARTVAVNRAAYGLPVCERTPVVKNAILKKIPGVSDCSDVTAEHLAAIEGDLRLGYRSISTLKAGDFEGLSNLNGLNLQHNSLTTLPSGLFDDLTNARWVRLNDNQLASLDEDTFSGMDNLRSAFLGGNELETIPAGFFTGRTNLHTISLYNNDLTSIPAGAFDGLVNMRNLDLQSNELTTLPAGLFKDLTGIETLQRDGAVDPGLCDLTQEEQDAVLDKLPDISDCRLVTDGDIAKAEFATQLPVCDRTTEVKNAIVAQIPGVSDCSDVTVEHVAAITGDLRLGYQSISTLQAGDFEGLSNLNGLNLQHNSLSSLPSGLFDDLTNARWVRLNDNQLTSLDEDTFSGMGNLRSVFLNTNSLETIPAGLFTGRTNLHTIFLYNNDLASIPAGAFDGLVNMRELDLRSNQLSTLPARLFKDLTGIKKLMLDSGVDTRVCELPQAEQDAILSELPNISDCRLVTDGDIALAESALPSPICDRTAAVRDAILDLMPGVADCAAVTTAHLASVTDDLLLERRGIATLKAGDFNGLPNVGGLDLRHNRLISLPAGLFDDLGQLSWLRLNDNRLITLDENAFSGLQNLRFVSLGSNNLRTIPPELFTAHANLRTIILYNNELTTIPAGAFDGLVSLHTVHLHENQMTGLPAGLFHDLVALGELKLDDAVNPRVCGRPGAEQEALLSQLPEDVITCLQVTDGDIAAAMPAAGVCGRTTAVRTAIVSAVAGVHDCAAVTDEHLAAITGNFYLSDRELATLRETDLAGLTNLEGLSLRYNRLTRLPGGAFGDLASLKWLKLDNNQLAVLPVGIFSELDNLTTLWLNNNKLAAVPTGLFDGLDELEVLHMYSNGLASLPAGLFADLTSIEKLWLDHAVVPRLCKRPQAERDAILAQLADIGDCRLATDGDVSIALAAMPSLPMCERTPAVRDAIVSLVPGITNCSDVTEEHLAGITGDLRVGYQSISTLKAGDFEGLTNLNGLNLQHNSLTSLPSGLFADLTNARWVRLNNNQLASLDEDTFSGMDNLRSAFLGSNNLETIPAGFFTGRTNLHTISLYNNELTSIPAGAFDGLVNMRDLNLQSNQLTTLPAGLFKDLTEIETLQRDEAVDPRLCELPQAEQDAILSQLPDISDCRLVTDSGVDSLSLPNIILIMADDLGYGDLGSYGQAVIQTPELDAMAAAGMRFTDFYSGQTICPPSREALLTGRHTGHTALRMKNWETMDQRFCDSRITIGQMLQFAGYRTAVIGKWGVGGESTPSQPNDQGFDYFYGYLEHDHAHNSYPDMLFRNKDQVKLANVLQRGRNHHTGGLTKPKGKVEYAQDLFMEEALKFIEEMSDAGQPFFLYLPLTPPHANTSGTGGPGGVMETPPDGYGQYADEDWVHPKKSYAAQVSYLDKDVGRLLDRLEELGISNDTVTFFTSDNGPHADGGFRPHYFFNSSGPFSGRKSSLQEGGIRAPLIAHWPGSITAGTVSDHVSAAWDFMPTLAQIADAPAPNGGDGVSMLPTLTGEGEQVEHEYLYWNYAWSTRNLGLIDVKAVRWGDWKAIHDKAYGMRLYDLSSDPGEQKNVAKANPDVVKKIEEIIAEAHLDKWEVRNGCYIK